MNPTKASLTVFPMAHQTAMMINVPFEFVLQTQYYTILYYVLKDASTRFKIFCEGCLTLPLPTISIFQSTELQKRTLWI